MDAFARVQGSVPLLYSHRGANRHATENTLRAFELGLDEGADGVELDVRMCASGEIVVFHDATLSRLAGDSIEIARTTWNNLQSRELRFGERMCLLDEALDLVLGRGKVVNVEVKGDVPDKSVSAKAVARALLRRTAKDQERVLVSTFHPIVFLALRRAAPGLALGFLFQDDGVTHRIVRTALRPHAVHPSNALADAPRISRWRDHGRCVNVWTVDDPKRAVELSAANVDGIITNDIPTLRRALGGTD